MIDSLLVYAIIGAIVSVAVADMMFRDKQGPLGWGEATAIGSIAWLIGLLWPLTIWILAITLVARTLARR